MIQEAAAVEHHARDALFLQPLGDERADRLGAGAVAAARALGQLRLHAPARRSTPTPAWCRRDRRSPARRCATRCGTRPAAAARACPAIALAQAQADAMPAVLLRLDLHGASPTSPRSCRPSSSALRRCSGRPSACRGPACAAADVGGDLAHQLTVDARDGDVRLLVDRHVDARRDVEHDRVRVAERELDLLALQLGAVADADDVELLLEALGDAGDGVGDEAARQAVELAQLAILAHRLRQQRAVFGCEDDARRQRPGAACPSGPGPRRRRR